jgi:hypothetical protein
MSPHVLLPSEAFSLLVVLFQITAPGRVALALGLPSVV